MMAATGPAVLGRFRFRDDYPMAMNFTQTGIPTFSTCPVPVSAPVLVFTRNTTTLSVF